MFDGGESRRNENSDESGRRRDRIISREKSVRSKEHCCLLLSLRQHFGMLDQNFHVWISATKTGPRTGDTARSSKSVHNPDFRDKCVESGLKSWRKRERRVMIDRLQRMTSNPTAKRARLDG